MPPLHALTAIGALLTLGACGPNGHETAARNYISAMAPVVAANASLGDHMVDLALPINAGRLDADGAAARLDAEVLPASRAVVSEALLVTVADPDLSAAHRGLVSAWSRRADAYSDLSRAWHSHDLAGYDAARAQIVTSTKDEAQSVAAINGVLTGVGLRLAPYPTMTVKP